MSTPKTESGNWRSAQRKNTIRLAYWTAAWLITMAVANLGPKFAWQTNELLSILAILVNLAVGFGMIIANKRHLKGLDEMQQKIQLEAMGLSLGVGLVVGLAYSNLDVTNLITSDAEISYLIILVSLTYLAGVFAGHRKYQ